MATLEVSRIELPEQIKGFVAKRRGNYPTAKALLVPTLMECQKYWGHVPPEAAMAVAELLGVPYPEVQSVISFYTMILRRPVGKYVIGVCRTWNCQHGGAHELIGHFLHRFGGEPGEVVANGLFTLLEVECLCDCGNAPSAQFIKAGTEFKCWWCNNLTVPLFEAILSEMEQGKEDALRERLVRVDHKANPPDDKRWVWIVTTNNQYPAWVETRDGEYIVHDGYGKLSQVKTENPKLHAELQGALKG
jgi:NADH-quinone oxidoreductase subunit E